MPIDSSERKPRTLHLGLFHQPLGRHPAAWRQEAAQGHPEDVDWAIRLARKAEEGLFDMFFVADNLAGPEPGAQGKAGGLEPVTLLSALAVATSRIGLVGTISTSFSEPYNVARLLASLDHISRGRAGWNVVTTQSDRAAENFGLEALPDHAARYARADEFVRVVRGLWDSWADDALVIDKRSGVFLDTDRVRLLGHKGAHFSVRGPLNISRPPQGHPVIVQAGSSRDGIGLAATQADLAFTAQDTITDSLAYRAALDAASRAGGRSPLKVLPGIMPIVGRSDAEAREKFAALQEHTDIAAGIRQLSGRWGYDLSAHPLDGPVPEPGERVHGESRVRLLLNKARAENYTLRELAALAIASHGHRIVMGSPQTIADDLQDWFEQGAADGFNLIPASMPDGLDDFVDLVVPVLQERGLFRRRYEEATLRERFGLSIPRLAAFGH
ncbi:LLM class flavin-dependent oxidoreductase [Bosea sp. (in: a-proteobacteria)]|uniref:LLM class flavin-dependent oxidoreductase n=1 Tax=Bosea sp. (in: a-proteobacteria) TaxID=1871050 RepID=UPI003341F693